MEGRRGCEGWKKAAVGSQDVAGLTSPWQGGGDRVLSPLRKSQKQFLGGFVFKFLLVFLWPLHDGPGYGDVEGPLVGAADAPDVPPLRLAPHVQDAAQGTRTVTRDLGPPSALGQVYWFKRL